MNIVLIDDDPIVSRALSIILQTDPEIHVSGIGTDGDEALALYRTHVPDVLLMDIRMQRMTGLVAGEQVLREYPDARVLFLTTFSDDDYIIKALRIGARGYLLKDKFDSIVPAIKAVVAGQSVFGEDIVSRFSLMSSDKQKSISPLVSSLTEKEVEIMKHLGNGLSNKEISEALYISEGTVRNAISLLLDKLSLKSRTQLAIFFLKNF
jgi:DNA-binding NarL/FixJ family response regulator